LIFLVFSKLIFWIHTFVYVPGIALNRQNITYLFITIYIYVCYGIIAWHIIYQDQH
jgi:hypothetical protein